ncbi:sensor histidine kinase [Sediminibacillus albus]|uniref:Sensor histidine kinase n=1 Tax=Sediminibacillus albus TaxID=407036 RepID=A0A1G8ZRY4_9BACI|nr:sensor histidine kinase [Sediminibacillus albus]SDK17869.1 two-component system, NarL family, sensor histidine kinase LiaS [Sediminibacillus albus]
MKTILQRSFVVGIFSSLILLLLLSAVYIVTFPVDDWSVLWQEKIVELPFLLFVVIITTAVGGSFGLAEGLFWKKQLTAMDKAFADMKQGSWLSEKPQVSLEEIQALWAGVNDIQTYIYNQTKLAQKMTNERVEDQEKEIERVISEERNRLARELHDSVSQELFAASMMISAMTEQNKEKSAAVQLKQIETMIQQSQLEMRALLLHLRPAALKGKSLQEGMRQLLAELKQKVPIEIAWKMDEVGLEKGIEDHLFRILQESVSNTLRHSKAHSLDVLLIKAEGQVIMRVIDDGVGFTVETSQSGSYGLQNMKERAAEVGASIKIISLPGKGTRLEVRVPVIESEGDEYD